MALIRQISGEWTDGAVLAIRGKLPSGDAGITAADWDKFSILLDLTKTDGQTFSNSIRIGVLNG